MISATSPTADDSEHSVLEDDSDAEMDREDYIEDDDIMDEDDDDGSSSLSIPNESIDFDLVYSLHSFAATVEGQANVVKGDSLFLMDDSNSYWWLVRVLKTQEVGYIPAENIETPFERLARLNKHRNIDLASATQAELQDGLLQSQDRLRQNINNSRQGRTDSPSQTRLAKTKTVDFNVDRSFHRYPPAVWRFEEEMDEDDYEDEDDYDVGEYYDEDPVLAAEKAAEREMMDRVNVKAETEAGSGVHYSPLAEHDDEMKWDDAAADETRAQQMAQRQQSQLPPQQQPVRASPSPTQNGITEQQRVSPTSHSPDGSSNSAAPLSISTSQNGQRRLVTDPFSEFDNSPNNANPSSPSNSSSTHETVKLTMTPTIARDDVFEGQQAGTYSVDERKRQVDDEDNPVAEDPRKRAKGVVSPVSSAPVKSSGPPSSGGGKLRKERDSGTRSIDPGVEDDSSGKDGKEKKKKSGMFGGLFTRKKDKKEGSKDLRDTPGGKERKSSASMEADIIVGPNNTARASEESGRRPSGGSAGASVESGMVSPTTAMAMQQQQPLIVPSTPPQNHHSAGLTPGGSTSFGSLSSAMSSTSTPPSSLTSSPAAQILRQRDLAQQALYQQYLNRSPSTPPDLVPNYGLQSASVVNSGGRWGRDRDATSVVQSPSNGLAPPTQRQRPGSLILTPETLASHPISNINVSSPSSGIGASPSATAPGGQPITELSVVRIFAGRGLEEDTEATFKTVLLNSQTSASELVGQAVQRFRLNVPSGGGHSTDEEEEGIDEPHIKKAKLTGPSSFYYLTIKQIEGGAGVKLKPDEKPLIVFESLVEDARIAREEREREERERELASRSGSVMATPKVKRSSVGSISSVASNLSMHPAIKKLPMNDFTDDSAVKFYLHKKGVDPEEDDEYDELAAYQRYSTEEGDETMVAADTSISSNTGAPDSGGYLSPSSSGSSRYLSHPALERLSSPLRFSLQLAIHPEDLPDDMVFDTVTEAIVFKGTLKDRERDSRRHSHASSASNTSATNSSIPQNFRRKVFVFPKNITVAEVIELGLERFGILEGVVDGGDEVEDKLTKRRSNAARVRYGLAVIVGDYEKELSPASRIIDAYPRPPTFRTVDKHRSKDFHRRSMDSTQILGTMDDLTPDDPVFVLRRATSYRTSTNKHRMSAPLDELALKNFHQQMNRDSIASSTRSGGTDSVPISPLGAVGFVDQQAKKKEIIAAQREAFRATQRAMLSTQANSMRGVDVLLPGNARLRSARVDTDDKMRYSYVEPDGEAYDISDIVEEEWHSGDQKGRESNKRDLLEGVVMGRPGAGEKLDRILGRIKKGKPRLQVSGQGSQQSGFVRSGSPSSQYSLDETVEAYGRSRSVTPAGSMASVTVGPKVVGQVNRAPSPASTAGVRPGTVTPTGAAGQRPDARRNPSIASVMTDLSGYATAISQSMSPSPIDETSRSMSGTPKPQGQHQRQKSASVSTGKKTPMGRPFIPKDDFGISQMMAIIEYRASKTKGVVVNTPATRDPVEEMLFGKQIDLASLHPAIRDIYADSFIKLDEVDQFLEDRLLRVQAGRRS